MILQKKLQSLFEKRNASNCEGVLTVSYGEIPATISEIELITAKIPLPNDYIEFLKRWNGCSIFNLDNIAGFTFFSTIEIEIKTNDFKEIYGEEWDDSIILFCSILGSGDFLGFRLNAKGYEIVDCCHDDLPVAWACISHSFYDFLEKVIDANGDSYWLLT